MQFQFTKHTYLLILVLAIGISIIVPGLLMQGMFMDGQQYACVAKNYANGKGSFWFPFLSQSWCMAPKGAFLEHPPLFYWLESFSFKLFGNSIFSERIFSLFMFVLNGFLIRAIWNIVTNKEISNYAWLPLFFFFGIPIVAWVFQNNIIEETLSVFTLLSIYFVLLAFKKTNQTYLYFISAGISVFLASLTKGLPGLFPIVAPLIYFFVFKKPSLLKAAFGFLIVAIVPIVFYFLIIKFNSDANESLSYYVKERLLNRIKNSPSTDSRFFILGGLFQELIPILLFSVITWYIGKKKIGEDLLKSSSVKWALFFLLIGLSGSLPLMLTLVQNKFYFFPALPFFAISSAFFVLPVIKKLVEVFEYRPIYLKRIKIASYVAIAIALLLCITSIGHYKRDKEFIADAYATINMVGNEKVIRVSGDVYHKWNFQFYVLRFGDISFDPSSQSQQLFFIDLKSSKSPVPDGYKLYSNELSEFVVYKRIK